MRRMLAALLAALLVAGGGVLWSRRPDAPAAAATTGAQEEPTQTVAAVTAVLSPWQDALEAIGDLRAVNGADLAPEVAGIVDQIGFTSGEDVPAGRVLLTLRLDDEPARLAQAQAMAELAQTNLDRDGREFAAQAVSHASVDTDRATLASDRAQVDAIRALIAEKTIRAPFAGRLGVRRVDLGQYLQPGTAIVSLEQLDPIYADVNVPENRLAGIRPGDAATVRVDGFPGRRFDARIVAITPKIDQSSRTALVRASLRNPDRALLPGMFARLSIGVGAPRDYVTLPQAALSYSTFGTTVFVIEHGVARQRLVETGPVRGDQVAVTRGLSAGQTVVAAGQVKLHDGTPVAIDDAVRPGDSAHPDPVEE